VGQDMTDREFIENEIRGAEKNLAADRRFQTGTRFLIVIIPIILGFVVWAYQSLFLGVIAYAVALGLGILFERYVANVVNERVKSHRRELEARKRQLAEQG